MKNDCYNEGTIQAFLDGELAPERLENIARHIALCDQCSLLLEQAEEESAIAFAALDEGLNTLVPSERIRAKVYGAISNGEAVREGGSAWERFIRAISFGKGLGFGTPLASFAALILAVGFVAIVLTTRPSEDNAPVANNIERPVGQTPVRDSVVFPTPIERRQIAANDEGQETEAPQSPVQKTFYRPAAKPQNRIQRDNGFRVENANYRPAATPRKFENNPSTKPTVIEPDKNTVEEDNFMRTIASLQQTVDTRKDEVLRPSQRIAYEKDMAVVNDTIKKMKKEVRRNPKNETARQVLRTSYQNKIDLLNSIAEKSELMASMQ